jgi:heme A synthase
MTEKTPSRLLMSMTLATALLTLGLIVFGAVVRVTDSGLGCGESWPLCNGSVFPPLDNLTAWIEWLHRLFAALIGLFGLVILGTAIRDYRASRISGFVLFAVLAAAGLFVVQSTLGALVVVLELPPTMVALHLGTAMLLLAALLMAYTAARHRPQQTHARDGITALVATTTALSLIIILTGSLVRGSGATLACVDWPLCNGEVFPVNQGQLALIHMFHRFAVAALGITLVLLVWQIRMNRRDVQTRRLALLALMVYLMQAGVGAMFVLTSAAPVWGASHVGLAAATWALLVVLSTVEFLNSREVVEQAKVQWKQQSDPL